jgi:hypothetical protein
MHPGKSLPVPIPTFLMFRLRVNGRVDDALVLRQEQAFGRFHAFISHTEGDEPAKLRGSDFCDIGEQCRVLPECIFPEAFFTWSRVSLVMSDGWIGPAQERRISSC